MSQSLQQQIKIQTENVVNMVTDKMFDLSNGAHTGTIATIPLSVYGNVDVSVFG